MITKRIAPVTAYGSLGRVQATSYTVRSMEDDLFGSVVFKHELITEEGLFACSASHTFKYTTADTSAFTGVNDKGELTCTWDASPAGAFLIVAQAMGFELLGGTKTDTAFFEG
jgi:hypothetical protein